MRITLEIVRQVLKEALGFDSFVASFITEVHEDPRHPTAGITKDGKLRYNPDFVAKYVSCREDLFSLIFHELLHPMFGHFIYSNGEIENIAADAIINAVISTLYSEQSRDGNLFRKTHKPRGLACIMRPGSELYNSRYWGVYKKLYSNGHTCQPAMTTGELIQTLKILAQTENFGSVMLLGTHGIAGDRESRDGSLSGLSGEVLVRLAEDIKRSVQKNGGMQAGYGNDLFTMFMEALRTHLSIKKALLQKFATKRKVDRFKELFQDRRIGVSPIPIHPSKRDLVLLASGVWPCYFHNHACRVTSRDRGLAIYLDVSGSVNEHLPKILGVLRSLRNELTTIYQFSNKVVETPFNVLLKGNIQTTYGTDFDCIAQSILDYGFDKAVIVTDGYASMADELKQELKRHGLVTLTILFGGAQNCEEFAEFGEIVQLEEVCE